MERMMTYSEANSVLEVSLSPSNRCLSKAVAIDNGANPDPLANFDNARLVPASIVEKQGGGEGPFTVTFINYDGSELQTGVYEKDETITPPPTPSYGGREFVGWFSTTDRKQFTPQAYRDDTYKATFAPEIRHFFIDSNGNNIGTEIYITVPKNTLWTYFETKTTLDGQPIPSEFCGKYITGGFTSGGKIDALGKNRWYSSKGNPPESMVYYLGGGYPTPYMFSNGVTKHPVQLSNPERYGPGWQYCALEINDSVANQYGLNSYIDNYNIIYHVEMDQNKPFYLSKGEVSLKDISVGDSVIVDVFGSNNFTVDYVQFIPEGSIQENPRFSKVTIIDNTFAITRTRTGDTSIMPQGWFDFYKVTDIASGEVIYLGVKDKALIKWEE